MHADLPRANMLNILTRTLLVGRRKRFNGLANIVVLLAINSPCNVWVLTAFARSPDPGLPAQRPPNAFHLDAGITPRLARNSKPTEYFVDRFGPALQPFGKTVEIRSGEDVVVSGWAIDAPAAALAGGVEIVIDGHAFKLPYFLTRADVAAAKRNEAYTDCGFLAVVPRELLPNGSHTVSLRIVSADRKTYYQSPDFRVAVRPT